jgi:hypothetical protein
MLVRVPLQVLGFGLLAFLCSCSRTLHLELPPGTPVSLETDVTTPGSNVVETRQVLLQPDAASYRRLQDWLAHNQGGWSQSLATNPSGGIRAHAGDLHLQFVGTAVFTWTDKGQFQKDVREEDYAFLKKPAGI